MLGAAAGLVIEGVQRGVAGALIGGVAGVAFVSWRTASSTGAASSSSERCAAWTPARESSSSA